VAREATARLYDVDHSTVVLKRLTQGGKYDEGTITFRAEEGKLIDLDQLFESLWATRLSGGTNSGVLKLEVTAVGEVVKEQDQLVLKVKGADDATFMLVEDPEATKEEGKDSVFAQLTKAVEKGDHVTMVTGRVDGWKGRWPLVLREKPAKPWRLFVISFEQPTQ
jgi:hypothetical protein